MRKIKTYLCTALALILILNFVAVFIRPAQAKAEDGLHMSAELEPLPSENIVSPGYLNRGNSGFRVNVSLDEGFTPYSIGIFLDSQTDPIDTRLYDTGQEYILSSKTASNSKLQSLLSYVGGVEAHSIHLKYKETEAGDYLEEIAFEIKVDFELPEGSFSASARNIVPPDTSSAKLFGIGDGIDFQFTPDNLAEEISQIKAKFNGRNLLFNPSTQIAQNIIQEGDPEQQINLVLTDVEIIDAAHNIKEYPLVNIPIDFSVDANSPVVSINSPADGLYFFENTIVFEYSVSDPLAQVTKTLDGEILDINSGELISNLAEGSHKITVEAVDGAGNKTVRFVNFTVDTTTPTIAVNNSPSGEIEQGEPITFEGTSEPGATIVLEVFSEPIMASTVADADGYFKIDIDSSALSLGTHEAYLTATDKAGNSLRIRLAGFEVIAKPVAQIDSESPRVAYADEEAVASDVKAQVIPEENKVEQVAKTGEVTSAQDSRNGINWSVWIIILAIVVLVSAVGAAGYYGYEWIMASNAATMVRKPVVPAEAKKEQEESSKYRSKKVTMDKEASLKDEMKEDEGGPRTRW